MGEKGRSKLVGSNQYSISLFRQECDYVIGLDTSAIDANKSKKLTRLVVPAHIVCDKV